MHNLGVKIYDASEKIRRLASASLPMEEYGQLADLGTQIRGKCKDINIVKDGVKRQVKIDVEVTIELEDLNL